MMNPVHWIYEHTPEMQLRLRPLREHWEARGPGMLRHAKKLLPWIALPERIGVRLVEPKQGGGGRVVNDEIEFEAVLANRHPQLPEVARLAWLVLCQATRANCENAVALIPPTLEAAEFVELARCDDVTLDLALSEWVSDSTPVTGSTLNEWWNALREVSDKAAWSREVAKLD